MFLKWAASLGGMLKDKQFRKNILYDLGFAYYETGRFEETINSWKEAWDLSQQLKDWKYNEEIAFNLANGYRRLDRF